MRRRTAVAAVALSVVAGTATGWAVTRGDDDPADVASTASETTRTPTPTPSATDADPSPAGGSGGSQSTGTGSLTVTIGSLNGKTPIEAGFGLVDPVTGADAGPPEGAAVDITTKTGTLSGIKPGTYVVTAGSDDDDWQAVFYGAPRDIYDRSLATPVTIRAGETVRITMTLKYWPNGEPPETGGGDPPTPEPTAPIPSPSPTTTATPDVD